MIIKTFPPTSQEVADWLAQAGIQVERAHPEMSVLHLPAESLVEDLRGEHSRRYKKITTPKGKILELDYYRYGTQGRLLIVVPKDPYVTEYPIYSVLGAQAQKYLTDCGCALTHELLSVPTAMTRDPLTGHVTRDLVMLFQIKRHTEDSKWIVSVPRPNLPSLHEVLTALEFDSQTASTTLRVSEQLVADMLLGVAVPRQDAMNVLDRLSAFTNYPYCLENVRVEVHDD